MSDKISYILEVQDNFSTATTKFKKQITAIDGILKSLNNELDLTSTKLSKFGKGLKFNFNANADLDKLSKSMDKVATSAGRMRKATSKYQPDFILSGDGKLSDRIFNASAIRLEKYNKRVSDGYKAWGIKNNIEKIRIQKYFDNLSGSKTQLALYNPPSKNFVMGESSSSSSISSPRRYSPNFTLPIDSSYRRNYSQSTALTPYNPNPYGTAVSIYGNYRGKIIEGVYKDVSEEILSATKNNSAYKGSARPVFAGPFSKIKFDNETGGWVSADKSKIAGYGMAGLLGGRLGANGIASGLGFAGAAYTVGRSVKYVHDTTVQMDSLRASLSALIPKVKGLEVATPESEVQYLRGVSDKYGLNFSDIAPAYVKMLGTGGKTDASLAKGLVENIGGYAGLLGLSGPATQDTMRGFQDMLSKQVLNAQEVNLQMQQLVGAKPMMHKAFYQISQRQAKAQGKKSPVTMENASMYFQAAMATGKLSADLMLREFIKVIEEDFGKKMLEKANKLGNEERRLASATQELATSFGDMTYDLQIGAVRGLTTFTKGLNDVTKDAGILGGYLSNLLSDAAKKVPPEVKNSVSKLVSAGPEIIWGGTQIAGMGLIAGLAGLMGNGELLKELPDTLQSKWEKDFTNTRTVYEDLKALGQAIIGLDETIKKMPSNQQKVEVKITTENMPDFFKVKQDQNMSFWRPETIGGR